jgi:hypothetical protein
MLIFTIMLTTVVTRQWLDPVESSRTAIQRRICHSVVYLEANFEEIRTDENFTKIWAFGSASNSINTSPSDHNRFTILYSFDLDLAEIFFKIYTGLSYYYLFDVSPDGNNVYFSQDTTAAATIYQINATNGDFVKANEDSGATFYVDSQLHVSPDNLALYYIVSRTSQSQFWRWDFGTTVNWVYIGTPNKSPIIPISASELIFT